MTDAERISTAYLDICGIAGRIASIPKARAVHDNLLRLAYELQMMDNRPRIRKRSPIIWEMYCPKCGTCADCWGRKDAVYLQQAHAERCAS